MIDHHYVWCNVAGFITACKGPLVVSFVSAAWPLWGLTWVSNSSMKQGRLKLLRALILDTQVWFAGITNGFTTTACFTWEGNVRKTKSWNATMIFLIFFRSTMIYTFIEDNSKSVKTNIDTTASFAWQRLVLCFPYIKEFLDLKTRILQM